ncbi:uncharacterized protein [Pempheris klunzingeri]|uniref:uncharacterized protein n=1 Tax=Pempheris klunzingeri TaxID=3127111 RepID=UPI00397F7E91
MYPNRSEYSHRRQYSDRGSRQWDSYDDRWEERRESHRDVPRDSHHKYSGDGQSCTERTSRSREYSDSTKSLYSKDWLSRDRSRKSPVRRHMSSPDWGASEKKRRRFTVGDEGDYRYSREPEDKTGMQSPDSVLRAHDPKDLNHTLPKEEDFAYKKTTPDLRHRYLQEEFTYRQQHDDVTCRRLSGYNKDRDGHKRSRDHSQERTQSQDHSMKSYAKPRGSNDSPSTDTEDHRINRAWFPLSGSNGQSFESDVTNHGAPALEQKSAKGFQRFLDVLNKGVNVDMLTKIVTQTSTEPNHRPHSPASFMHAADGPWSPSGAGRQQGSHPATSHWNESEGSQRLAPAQPRHRSFSPKERSLSNETSLQRVDGERSYGSNSRSGSPSAVEKMTLTPEDEHKHRHMQDVLQAIGMNLGFEELGQMSHRIQERLYGKKDVNGGSHRGRSRERNTRRALSPRPQSRSSSSSKSSCSPSSREYYMKKESYSAQRDVPDVHQAQADQAVGHGQNSSSSILQVSENSETNSQENTAASQAFPQNPIYTSSEPSPPSPVMPMYSQVNSSPLPYLALPPVPPPALLPNLSQVGPGLYLPRLPPFFPYPRGPPLNIFPAVLTQSSQLLPQHVSNPYPALNLPGQPLNSAQKSKTVSRPRCLQVIETKQPG